LTWHQPGPLALSESLSAGDIRKTYVLDGDYHVKKAWIVLDRNSSGTGTLDVDIRVDGVSIFSLAPALFAGTDYEEETKAFASVQLSNGTKVTCHITGLPTGEPGHDATIGLDLEEA
jgi:hypothetical protein